MGWGGEPSDRQKGQKSYLSLEHEAKGNLHA